MTLRRSIEAMLLVAVMFAVMPARTLRAAEAASPTVGAPATANTAGRDTSAYAPRLIDPQSPPPSEAKVAPAPTLAGPTSDGQRPAGEAGTAVAKASDSGDDVLNRPAVDDIELQMNADVLKYIAFFTGAGRSTFERWLKRSGRYMDLFRSVLQKEGLPPDLVHLVFVESGFNVNARSYAAAVGPWQFMRSSAQLFGLNVNQWVDERKDPEKATVAAARYLKHLYSIFGDWPLALASYNAGEGTVMRAIQSQGTTNYWELRLPKQTEEYVPQFMAALAISRDPVKYGFGDIEMDDPMRFDEVAMKGAVDLRSIAKLAECSYDELRELNPSARTAMLRGPNGITTVRVPEGKSELIQKNLAAGVELPTVNLTVRHRVRRGETLRMIATEYSVNPTELARVNNLGRGRPLRRGMLLTVPASFRAPRPEVLADEEDPRTSTDYVPPRTIGLPGKVEGNSVAIERITHTVKRGETLVGIALQYGLDYRELAAWNNITNPNVISPGRVLVLAAPRGTQP
ncbi:MAG TPA: transglycosylase SLT domain-containing protein, partial [Gaiellales bacterium]|nr:transglycosylase SLT domain-containing protein [Gaiellales bacterium]